MVEGTLALLLLLRRCRILRWVSVIRPPRQLGFILSLSLSLRHESCTTHDAARRTTLTLPCPALAPRQRKEEDEGAGNFCSGRGSHLGGNSSSCKCAERRGKDQARRLGEATETAESILNREEGNSHARALAPVPAHLPARVRQVVVLFEENRSFDHLFGWAKDVLGVDGLTGKETNPVDLDDSSKGTVAVSPGATYINTIDPNHGFPAYKVKVFGGGSEDVARMDGFFDYEHRHHGFNDSKFVMQGFEPAKLPITVGLAQEFAVFDKLYAAFPGPSWPNHMFSYSGTSGGCTETGSCEFSWKMRAR